MVGADHTVIDRATIGVSSSGSLIGNSGPGVLLEQGTGTVIGTDGSFRSNVIAGNHAGGIVIKSGSGNTFRNLEMYANEGLAIDLGGDGATPNDPLDVDSGSNGLQNVAELSQVFDLRNGRAEVRGTMRSARIPHIGLSLYRVRYRDISGNAGSIEVVTDSEGVVPFTCEIFSSFASHVTAVVTNLSTGDSSEVSPHVEIVPFPTSLQISKDKKTATWVDVDGDLVTLKVNRPVLEPDDFVLAVEGSLRGERLVSLNLNPLGEPSRSAVSKISINAQPRKLDTGLAGNSRVDIGVINASNCSLTSVFIDGDISGLFAARIRSFEAHSVGAAPSVDPAVTFFGDILVTDRIDSFTVADDVVHTRISAKSIGSLNIHGDFDESWLNVERRLASFRAENVIGDSIEGSGAIRARTIGAIHLLGDLVGGTGPGTGTIAAALIGPVRIDGDILGGEGGGSGIRAAWQIGPVRVGGDIAGHDVAHPVVIQAFGATGPLPYVIASLSVKGDVRKTQVLAGSPNEAGQRLGPIDVRGNWESSIAAASIDPGEDNLFGTPDDRLGGTAENNPVIRSIARIARITIRGTVSGTEAAGDSFGFFAQHVGPVRIHGSLASAGVLAGTDDVRLLEVLTRQG